MIAMPTAAIAQTRLTTATVESIRNRVQVILGDQDPRAARLSDIMEPGDGLTTGQSSLAELRFNDGSLGRLGEQVIFWFTPGTRNFSLSNGTVLLLIPPGNGSTYIRTPNAAAGIQGSALFVRYIEATDTTLIGALTNSGIRAYNDDGSEVWELEAGQMAVAVGDRLEAIYDFDLDLFHDTSALMEGLSPQDGMVDDDPSILLVQEEMQQALNTYAPIGNDAMTTPDFVALPRNADDAIASDPVDPSVANNTAVLDAARRDMTGRTAPTMREIGEVVQEQRQTPSSADRPPASNPNNSRDRTPSSNQGNRDDSGNANHRSDRTPDDRDNNRNAPGNRDDVSSTTTITITRDGQTTVTTIVTRNGQTTTTTRRR
jgi:hypothetical protein